MTDDAGLGQGCQQKHHDNTTDCWRKIGLMNGQSILFSYQCVMQCVVQNYILDSPEFQHKGRCTSIAYVWGM